MLVPVGRMLTGALLDAMAGIMDRGGDTDASVVDREVGLATAGVSVGIDADDVPFAGVTLSVEIGTTVIPVSDFALVVAELPVWDATDPRLSVDDAVTDTLTGGGRVVLTDETSPMSETDDSEIGGGVTELIGRLWESDGRLKVGDTEGTLKVIGAEDSDSIGPLTDGKATDDRLIVGNVKDDTVSVGKVTDCRVTDGRVTDDKVIDGNVTDGRVTDGKVTDDRVTDGRVTDGKVADGRATDGRVAEARLGVTLTAEKL